MQNLTTKDWELIHYTLLMAFCDKSHQQTEMLLNDIEVESEDYTTIKRECSELLELLEKIR